MLAINILPKLNEIGVLSNFKAILRIKNSYLPEN